MIKLDPIGVVYLPTCTIQINQMLGKNTSSMDLMGTDLMSDFLFLKFVQTLWLQVDFG